MRPKHNRPTTPRPRHGPPLADVQALFDDPTTRARLADLEAARGRIIGEAHGASAKLGQVEAYLRGLGYSATGEVAVNAGGLVRIAFCADPASKKTNSLMLSFHDPRNKGELAVQRWANTPMVTRIAAAAHLPALLARIADAAGPAVDELMLTATDDLFDDI